MPLKYALAGAALFAPSAASAATVVILTDPMSLERRTVVLNTPGPDRVLLCAQPPAMTGCRELHVKR
jgi:hypothetical protein